MTEPTPAERAAATRRAALASVSVALLLMVLKGMAAAATGSVAVLGSLADTGLDLLASLVTLYSVHIAALPADAEHRFGHGKAEALAALFQTALIMISAVAIAARGIARLGAPAAPAEPAIGIAVSAVAILLSLVLVAYQRRVIARTGSLAITADSLHYQSDLILNLSVIVALVLDAGLGLRGADPAFGLLIAAWLAWNAWKAAARAVDQLMDHEWPEERRHAFLAAAASHPELRGIHDLRTRSSGAQDFVQFHVWVDPDMTVAEAHRVMDEVEARLERQFPGVEVLIHTDPEGQQDPPGPATPPDHNKALKP